MATLPLDDEKTYRMLTQGDSVGVFQFESGGMQDYLRKLKPTVIEDIINMIPAIWLDNDPRYTDREAHRAAYIAYLLDRLAASHIFVEEALHARAELL